MSLDFDEWEPSDDDAPDAPPTTAMRGDARPAAPLTPAPPAGVIPTAAPLAEATRPKREPSGKAATTISEVLTQWAEHGPLIHEPTGIPPLDEWTGGGPVYGARWYFGGSPDAGKTALLVQLL